MNLVDTLTQAFNDALADVVNAIPTVIGALLILLIGLIVGRIDRRHRDRHPDPGQGGCRVRAIHQPPLPGETPGAARPSEYIGTLAKWLIYLVFFLSAANFLGWSQVSLLYQRLPGVAAEPDRGGHHRARRARPRADYVRRAIEASGGGIGLSNTGLLGRVAEFTVIAFGVILALYQVGIASELVNILFIGVVLAMALAFGLAFGLGRPLGRRRDVTGLVSAVDGGRGEDRRGRG